MMYWNVFVQELQFVLPKLLTEVLEYRPQEHVYGVAFVTTDDFYGMYVAFETQEAFRKAAAELPGRETNYRQWAANEWGYSSSDLPNNYDKELYQNLVQVVEHDTTIDFTSISSEKWNFAMQFITALGEALKAVPESVFVNHGYTRQDILFYATMSDGDYMEEMERESAVLYNTPQTAKTFLDYLS